MTSIWLFTIPAALLLLSLFITIAFYQKSIMVLRDQREYELKSTKSYIKNLQCFSLAKLFTYGPLVLMLFLSPFSTFSVELRWRICGVSECLASLSGFISAMIFICQGSTKHSQPKFEYNSDNDLTQDMI